MENGKSSREISSPDVVYTLMKASQSESMFSSSTDQSTSANTGKKLHSQNHRDCINNHSNTETKISIKKSSRMSWMTIKMTALRKLVAMLFKINWSNYIRWRVLLSFGLVLWIALCITDKYYLRPSLSQKVEAIVNPSVEKILYLKLACAIDDNEHERWFFKMWSYICWTITLSHVNEAHIFAMIIGVVICVEIRLRNSMKNPRESFTQWCNDFIKVQSLDSKYNNNDFAVEILNEGSENMYDELGVLSRRKDPRAVKITPYEGLQFNTDMYWQWRILDKDIGQAKRHSNRHFNKLGIQSQMRNIDTTEWAAWKQLDPPSPCICDYATPFDLRTRIQPVSTIPSYDTEINQFIKSKRNSSTTAFEEIIGDLQRFKNNFVQKKPSNVSASELFTNEIKNNRIISSSPAFKQFLLRLKNNPTSFNKFADL